MTRLFRTWYAGAEPSEWHHRIPGLAWECIWTFNIDDVIETSYANSATRAQRLRSALWRERPTPFAGGHDVLTVVHLHGYVGDIARRDDPQLVFSLSDYLDARSVASHLTWHTTFRSQFPTSPVIVLGARLSEEVDFAEVIRDGNSSAQLGLPSVVVLPSFSSIERSEFERWGFVPIESTAEDFMLQLADAVAASPSPSALSGYASRYTDRTLLPLTDELGTTPIPGHDFYGGHEPEWFYIANDLDAHPRWLSRLVREIGSSEDFPEVQRLYVLAGSAFTGKSTALMRIGRELQGMGWEPVYVTGWETIDPNEVLKYLASRPRAVLLIDPLSQDARDVADLLREAETRSQRLVIIGADRTRQVDRIRRVVPFRYVVGAVDPLFFEPTDEFWWQVLIRRGERARLGRLERAPERLAKQFFVERGRDLFSALAQLEDSRGFIDRGMQAFNAMEGDFRLVFAVVSLLARHSLPTPLGAAAAVAGVSVQRLATATAVTGDLGDWIRQDPNEIGLMRLRHRFLGELLLRGEVSLPEGVSLPELAQSVCVAIADRVSVEAIVQRTLEYRIAAGLMDEEFVRWMCHSDEVDWWFDGLEQYFSWNARFWEQRALASARDLDRAYSFAQRAVSKHRDAFSLNTLGTVLMRRAVTSVEPLSLNRRADYWREALEVLIGSRDKGRGRFEHPYVTFFHYTALAVALDPAPTGAWRLQVEQAFRDWYLEARRSRILDDPEVRSLAEKFPELWRN